MKKTNRNTHKQKKKARVSEFRGERKTNEDVKEEIRAAGREWTRDMRTGMNKRQHVYIDDPQTIIRKARQGHWLAQFQLGSMYVQGMLNGSFQEGVELIQKSADQGYVRAQYTLGCFFAEKEWPCYDLGQSLHYFALAAEQEDTESMIRLGIHYIYQADPPDVEKGMVYYQRAAELGNVDALIFLGYVYGEGNSDIPKDTKKSFEYFMKAAEKGSDVGQLNVGVAYAQGVGVELDFDKSLAWYKKAAAQGNPRAKANLGSVYLMGRGVDVDVDKALKLFKEAAQKDDPQAQFNLGHMYEEGLYVEKDMKKAIEYYTKAAEQGEPRAQLQLSLCCVKGDAPDLQASKQWLEKAAENGSISAQLGLGKMYEEGIGGPSDYGKAFSWYRKAATQEDLSFQNGIAFAVDSQSDSAERLNAYKKEIDALRGEAWYRLGQLYKMGRVSSADPGQADACMEKARNLGYQPSN